jgi:hypothetical protein
MCENGPTGENNTSQYNKTYMHICMSRKNIAANIALTLWTWSWTFTVRP